MRVLVVDDTILYGRALADALAAEPSIDAVETAADVDAALGLLEHPAPPTVVLLSMAMCDGAGVLGTIVRAAPAAPVIALGVSERDDDIIACAEAGVAGCLLRSESYADLIALIVSAGRGDIWCSPRVAAALRRRVATMSGRSRAEPPEPRLTAREREVMRLVDMGLSNQQIARRLSIELRTVKNHVQHVLAKYQVHRRADAAALCRGAGEPDRAQVPKMVLS